MTTPEVREVLERVPDAARELRSFPHPSHCDHLHDAAGMLEALAAAVRDLEAENEHLGVRIGYLRAESAGHFDRAEQAEARYAEAKDHVEGLLSELAVQGVNITHHPARVFLAKESE